MNGPRETEINDFNLTGRANHNVLRFQITVNDTLGMSSFQTIAHLREDLISIQKRQRAASLQMLFQVRSAEIFHGNIMKTIHLRDIVNPDDVRMSHPAGQ